MNRCDDMANPLSWDDIDHLLNGFDESFGTLAPGESTGPAELLLFIEMADEDDIPEAVRAWYAGFSGTELYQAITAPAVDKAEAADRLRAMAVQVKRA